MIKGVIVSPLNLIDTPGGFVMHAMKETSIGFAGFGEAYFSQVHNGSIKAWKRHKEMTLNIVVPIGEIKFVLFDDRNGLRQFQEIIISRNNYCRLTIPPMIWLGFQGLSVDTSTLLNIANIEHNPKEVDRLEIEKIFFDWEKNI
tara:strand:+ start:217 stop:648 length:432 start_codon:yes stop_codon:yes gene_type:complete